MLAAIAEVTRLGPGYVMRCVTFELAYPMQAQRNSYLLENVGTIIDTELLRYSNGIRVVTVTRQAQYILVVFDCRSNISESKILKA